MSRSRLNSDGFLISGSGAGCGCFVWLAVLAFNLTLGGMSVNYLLEFFLNKNIPAWGDVLIGLFVAEISVPVAVVVWLLRFFGAV